MARNYGYHLEVTVTVEDVNEAPLVTGTTPLVHVSGERHGHDLYVQRH